MTKIPSLCTSYNLFVDDDHLREEWINRPRWIAKLSSGETIVQDDYRLNVKPSQTWLRLKQYIVAEKLNIDKLWLQFRTHDEYPVPEKAAGYFFSNCVVGILGVRQTLHFYLIGYLQDNKVFLQKWKVPELFLVETETRELSSVKEDQLIRNHYGLEN